MSSHTWNHTPDLEIRIESRGEPVPEPFELWLTGPAGVGLSDNAGADLLRLDARLCALVRYVRRYADLAERSLSIARDIVQQAAGRRGRAGRVAEHEADRVLLTAISYRSEVTEALDDTQTLVEYLREWIIGLNAPDGALRDAADGWQRDPTPPQSVQVFRDEESFMELDSRRARATSWGRPELAGLEYFGSTWRRDHDDEPVGPDQDTLVGTWAIGYLPSTAELYAVRRAAAFPSEVWLLGRLADLTAATAVLEPIMQRMRAPNSLILAAESVTQAQRADPVQPTTAVG